jgi:hypothetical protein
LKTVFSTFQDCPSAGSVPASVLPTDVEVGRLLTNVRRRIVRLVRRHGIDLAGEDDATDPLALDSPALAQIRGASVLGRGATGPRAGHRVMRLGADPNAAVVTSGGPRHVHSAGFDLHANVAVRAGERTRLEHLCRYVLRPPLAQDALERTADSKVLLRLRRPWRDGTRAICFEPTELLERLAAMVPRPRTNLLIYHGAFAPRGCRRVAAALAGGSGQCWRTGAVASAEGDPTGDPNAVEQIATGEDPPAAKLDGGDPATAARPPPAPGGYVRPRHFPWADLLRRTFEIDILACPDCGGRLRLLATIEDPEVVAKILAHLDLPIEAPEPSPARSLDWLPGFVVGAE